MYFLKRYESEKSLRPVIMGIPSQREDRKKIPHHDGETSMRY